MAFSAGSVKFTVGPAAAATEATASTAATDSTRTKHSHERCTCDIRNPPVGCGDVTPLGRGFPSPKNLRLHALTCQQNSPVYSIEPGKSPYRTTYANYS